MTVLTEGPRAGNYIADEVSVNLSRKSGVVATGSGVVLAGTVLGLVSTKWVPLNAAGNDGSENAVGILHATVDATSADADAVATVALTAVNAAELIWPAGISDGDKNDAIAQLLAREVTVLAADPIPSGS